MEDKQRELGLVKKIHPSGIVDTDKGFKVNIQSQVGDRLVQNMRTRDVTIATKKTSSKNSSLKIKGDEYNTLNQLELADKYDLNELRFICKSLGIAKYSNWDQSELCEAIATKQETLKVDETNV